jgi:predicted PurR-regulated permease PerM
MLNNQNTFQNAGQNGYFFYQSIGNINYSFLALFLVLILLRALLRSEQRYHQLVESMHQVTDDR